MARKTFISYKYSESRDVRNRIIDALGNDAIYYQGETSDSPDLSDSSTENIKKHLSNMMYDTSVTIVVLSPNMKDSKWIPWEIEYSLKNISRKGRTSHKNGIVAVIKKVNGSYDWLVKHDYNCHGIPVVSYELEKLPQIIAKNIFNSNPKKWHCSDCETYDALLGSYISFIEEDSFLLNPSYYIENAYEKSENDAAGYDLKLS